MTASASCRRCLQQLLPGMMVLGLPLAALAAGIANVPPVPRQSIDAFSQVTQLAQSWADEYFYGIGNTNNLYVPTGIDPTNCPAGSVPKVNQSYIWGMAKSGDDIYFGTLANANVVVSEVYLGANAPSQSFSTVQETTNSYYGKLHGGTEDWRPPQLFRYNIPSHTLTLLDTNLPAADFDALQLVGGIRAGGATPATKANPHRMVMLAGIAVAHDGLSPTAVTNADGLTFFLFDATTMRFVAHAFRPQWTNIRRFAELNGDLYFGVQKPNVLGGAVVRWVNNPAAAGYPFAFQEVGNLDNMGADICIHQGQLFVSTWPGYVEGSTNQIMAAITNAANLYKSAPGIWRSPTVPATGLTTAHANQWQKIWSVANYEPDVVTALTLGCGALASFDGYLYFGTIQVPLTGYVAHNLVYPYNAPTNTAGQTLINANTQRATSLFRAHNFRAPVSLNGIVLQQGADVELLYGNTQYPTWVPSNSSSGAWVSTTNLMGQAAAMGPAGFGTPTTSTPGAWPRAAAISMSASITPACRPAPTPNGASF